MPSANTTLNGMRTASKPARLLRNTVQGKRVEMELSEVVRQVPDRSFSVYLAQFYALEDGEHLKIPADTRYLRNKIRSALRSQITLRGEWDIVTQSEGGFLFVSKVKAK